MLYLDGRLQSHSERHQAYKDGFHATLQSTVFMVLTRDSAACAPLGDFSSAPLTY